MRSFSVLALALSLTACADATAPRTEPKPLVPCEKINWKQTGFQDGLRGGTMAIYERRVAECNPQRARPNRLAYSTGRLEGLKRYCSPQNGYALGLKGQPIRGACPPALEKGLKQGHAKGLADRSKRL